MWRMIPKLFFVLTRTWIIWSSSTVNERYQSRCTTMITRRIKKINCEDSIAQHESTIISSSSMIKLEQQLVRIIPFTFKVYSSGELGNHFNPLLIFCPINDRTSQLLYPSFVVLDMPRTRQCMTRFVRELMIRFQLFIFPLEMMPTWTSPWALCSSQPRSIVEERWRWLVNETIITRIYS